ncbi:hypothetical protein V8E54_003175 [Elaphomyces granulatus]
MDIDKDPGVTEPTWGSIYPTPDPLISYLSNTGVESGKSIFAMFPMEKVPDLPDIEPAIIDEIKQQQNDKFFDFRQNRVPLLQYFLRHYMSLTSKYQISTSPLVHYQFRKTRPSIA